MLRSHHHSEQTQMELAFFQSSSIKSFKSSVSNYWSHFRQIWLGIRSQQVAKKYTEVKYWSVKRNWFPVKLCCRCAQKLTAACTLTFVHDFNTCWKLDIWMWLNFFYYASSCRNHTWNASVLQDLIWKFHFHCLDFFSPLWHIRNSTKNVRELIEWNL